MTKVLLVSICMAMTLFAHAEKETPFMFSIWPSKYTQFPGGDSHISRSAGKINAHHLVEHCIQEECSHAHGQCCRINVKALVDIGRVGQAGRYNDSDNKACHDRQRKTQHIHNRIRLVRVRIHPAGILRHSKKPQRRKPFQSLFRAIIKVVYTAPTF